MSSKSNTRNEPIVRPRFRLHRSARSYNPASSCTPQDSSAIRTGIPSRLKYDSVASIPALSLIHIQMCIRDSIWYNAGKHTVDGTAYDDALEFHLNKDTKKIAKMTWFKDLYGNLIGRCV